MGDSPKFPPMYMYILFLVFSNSFRHPFGFQKALQATSSCICFNYRISGRRGGGGGGGGGGVTKSQAAYMDNGLLLTLKHANCL